MRNKNILNFYLWHCQSDFQNFEVLPTHRLEKNQRICNWMTSEDFLTHCSGNINSIVWWWRVQRQAWTFKVASRRVLELYTWVERICVLASVVIISLSWGSKHVFSVEPCLEIPNVFFFFFPFFLMHWTRINKLELSTPWVPQVSMVCIILFASNLLLTTSVYHFPIPKVTFTEKLWLSFTAEIIVYGRIIYYFWLYIIPM